MTVPSETRRDEVEGLLIILDQQNSHCLGRPTQSPAARAFGAIGLDGNR
jgi:hypothetical protein